MSELTGMIQDYRYKLDELDALEAERKELKAQIEAMEDEIAEQMVTDNCPSIEVGNYKYAIKFSTKWNKHSEADLLREGISDYLQFLRDNGLGSIIKETVDTRTLNSALNSEAEMNQGELPGNLGVVFYPFSVRSISCTKTRARKPRKA